MYDFTKREQLYITKSELWKLFVSIYSISGKAINLLREDKDDCFKSCPVECNFVMYEVEHSQLPIGNDMTYKRLQQQVPGWKNKSHQDISAYIRYTNQLI